MARAGMPMRAASANRSSTRAAPSSIEYSVCTWRCAKLPGMTAVALLPLPTAWTRVSHSPVDKIHGCNSGSEPTPRQAPRQRPSSVRNRCGTTVSEGTASSGACGRRVLDGRPGPGPGGGQAGHALAGVPGEAALDPAAEQPEAEPDDRVGDVGRAGDDVDAELDLAAVQPLADLVVHLPHLQVPLEGAVAPAPAPQPAAVDGGLLVDQPADADAEAEPQAPEAALQQQVAPVQRAVGGVDGPDDGRVGELVVGHQPPGDLELDPAGVDGDAAADAAAGQLGRPLAEMGPHVQLHLLGQPDPVVQQAGESV